jgi:hypothetical protein
MKTLTKRKTAERLTFAEYVAAPGVNWSTLKEARKSLAHYRAACETTRADSAAMLMGRAAHTAVLEPDRFPLEYGVYTGGRRAGKDWEAFADANEGRTILKADEYGTALAIRDAVHAHPLARKLLARKGVAEATLRWTDPGTGLPCKARPDWLTARALVDLKTTRDGDLWAFARTATKLGYHGQLAYYGEGVLQALGRKLQATYIIVAEQQPPFDVAVLKVPADVLDLGRELCRDLLTDVAEGYRTKKWPGRYPSLQTLELPEWAYGLMSDEIEVLS